MTDLEGAVERVVWRWQDEPITSLSHGERLEWYLDSPVFDRAGPFSTKDEAEAVNAARAGLKITLEQFARLLEPRDWEEFDRIGDRYGFYYDKIYASMRSALRILTAWSPEVLDLRDRAVKAETALASITRERDEAREENERLTALLASEDGRLGEIVRLRKEVATRTRERDAMREGLKVAQAYALPTLNGIIESNVNAEIIATAQADKDLIAALVNGEGAQ